MQKQSVASPPTRGRLVGPVSAASCLLLALAWAAGLGASPAAAETVFEERYTLGPDAVVSVSIVGGSLTFEGWGRDEVEISGTLGDRVEDIEVTRDGNRVEVEVRLEDRGSGHRWGPEDEAHLTVRLPTGGSIEAETVSADVEVRDFAGRIEAQTVSGDLALAGGPPEAATLQSVSGDVETSLDIPRLEVSTVSGDAEIGGAVGELEAQTVSGELVYRAAAPVRRASLQAVSGDVRFEGELAFDGELSVQTHSGTATVAVPESTSAVFALQTFSGSVVNELGPPAERTGRHGPGEEVRFTLGGGDGRVELQSFSGEARLVRR